MTVEARRGVELSLIPGVGAVVLHFKAKTDRVRVIFCPAMAPATAGLIRDTNTAERRGSIGRDVKQARECSTETGIMGDVLGADTREPVWCQKTPWMEAKSPPFPRTPSRVVL